MALRMTGGRWLVVVVAAVIAVVILNAYTTRSEFCGRCHSVMGEYYESWRSSTHAEPAGCLDCHSDPGLAGFWGSKVEGARNALSYYFGVRKSRKSPPPGRAACLREGCHTESELVARTSSSPFAHASHLSGLGCLDCHPGVGHEPVGTEGPRDCGDWHGEGGTAQPGR